MAWVYAAEGGDGGGHKTEFRSQETAGGRAEARPSDAAGGGVDGEPSTPAYRLLIN